MAYGGGVVSTGWIPLLQSSVVCVWRQSALAERPRCKRSLRWISPVFPLTRAVLLMYAEAVGGLAVWDGDTERVAVRLSISFGA